MKLQRAVPWVPPHRLHSTLQITNGSVVDAIEYLMTNFDEEQETEEITEKKAAEEKLETRRSSLKKSNGQKSGAMSKKELRKLSKKNSASPTPKNEARDSEFITV